MDKIILNRPERRRFTRINCSLPIKFIAKSGIGETDSDLREYAGWGRNISDFVTKPFDVGKLRKLVDNLTKNSEC